MMPSASVERPTISVLVPTYRRTCDLQRCLDALMRQTRPINEVLVTVRSTDVETQQFFADFKPGSLPLRLVPVSEPGVIAAMSAGLEVVQGDILALTDDDAAPWPDWLERIEAHFVANPRLGGVGGRDYIHYENGMLEARRHPDVGRVQWHGRVIGNHHFGYGLPRMVDLLKGVNSAYRVEALRPIGFDHRLRGEGAQVHWELSLGLALKQRDWILVYDPLVGVEHYPSQRRDADTNPRGIYHAATHIDIVYNETLILLDYLSLPRRAAFLLWATLIGSQGEPGIGVALYLLFKRVPHSCSRFITTAHGRIGACKAFLTGKSSDKQKKGIMSEHKSFG